MASVYLNFVPPTREGLVSLLIYEAPSSDPLVPAALIETVTDIGVWPNYISDYTTANAGSTQDWFQIRWQDDKGAQTGMSERIQGGTDTLIGTLVSRVQLRNPFLNETVITQEAEYVITEVLGVDDPYDPTLTATYRQMEGMTLLIQARTEIATVQTSQASGEDFTAGLVSMKSGATSTDKQATIDYLISEAARVLGLNAGIVAQMACIEIAGGFAVPVSIDQSRLLMIEII